MEIPVYRLEPGSAFRVSLGQYGNLDYRLIHANSCRAYVEPLSRHRRAIKDADGDVMAEFDAPGGRQNIAPGTMCTRLTDVPVSIPGDNVPKGTSGKPAAPQILRPASLTTKRGKVIAMLVEDLTGETSIPAIMSAIGMTRSAVLTYCFEINRDHGIGYEVHGDIVRVTVPNGTLFKETPNASPQVRTQDRRKEDPARDHRRAGPQTGKVQVRKKPAVVIHKRKLQNRP